MAVLAAHLLQSMPPVNPIPLCLKKGVGRTEELDQRIGGLLTDQGFLGTCYYPLTETVIPKTIMAYQATTSWYSRPPRTVSGGSQPNYYGGSALAKPKAPLSQGYTPCPNALARELTRLLWPLYFTFRQRL